MIEHDDRHLQGAFEALRRSAATGTPSFAATVAGARARRATTSGRRLLAVAAAVSVALVAVLFRRGDRDGMTAGIDLATVRWRAPTDFLLTLPGDELLRTVPRLGRPTFDRRTL